MPHDVAFTVGDERCEATHFAGVGTAFAGESGRPCVVMAHGFGATRDCGLNGYATGLSDAGLDVLTFDYRGFGRRRPGAPRPVDPAAQRQDYHAAVAYARGLTGVDPGRIIAWGVSLAGGHVLRVAAEDARIAAVIAVTPAPDGFASVRSMVRVTRGSDLAATGAASLIDGIRAITSRAPKTVAIVGPPGSAALMTAPGAAEGYARIAGPSWVNQTPARSALRVGWDRPARHAKRLRCPVLIQIADQDQTAPPDAARRAAWHARAEVRGYPCDHFDVYPGTRWFAPALEHQLLFLRRHCGIAAPDH